MANKQMKDVFFIKPAYKEGGKPFWMNIGVAFVNKDGSISLKLDVPVVPGMDIQVRDKVDRQKDGESFED